jgi:hypothetical protein
MAQGRAARRPESVTRAALSGAVRSMHWLSLGVAGLVSVSIVAWRHGHEAAVPMQAAALLLAGGVGFALDDPAAEILAPSPTPLVCQRLLRLLVVMPTVALLFGLLLRWQGTEDHEETLALILLFAGLVGLSLAAAGVAGRTSWARGRGGVAAPPSILFLVFISSAIPGRWRPLPFGDVPGGWTQIYVRWAVAAAAGMVVLLLSSRDQATRGSRPSLRGRSAARPRPGSVADAKRVRRA